MMISSQAKKEMNAFFQDAVKRIIKHYNSRTGIVVVDCRWSPLSVGKTGKKNLIVKNVTFIASVR